MSHEVDMTSLSGAERFGMGDFPPDYGFHVPGQADALRNQIAPFGYRPPPARPAIERKFGAEIAADVSAPERQARALEGANLVVQQHPIQDAPFFAQPIYATSGTININAGANSTTTLAAILQNNIAFVRNIAATITTAGGDAALRITMLVNGNPLPGLVRVPLIVFSDIVAQNNTYIRLMQGQTLSFRIDNDGGAAHTCRVSLWGWQYPASKIIETSRGVIPNENVSA